MQMMFFGVVFIAAFGAAGVLSAIAATYQSASGDINPGDIFQEAARNYLIGTSVSYHGHNIESKFYSLLYKSSKCVRVHNVVNSPTSAV